MHNFDIVYNRRNQNSLKWENDKVLSMGLADMDFKCPQVVLDKLHTSLNNGILGYPIISDDYFNSVITWYDQSHNLKLNKDNLLPVSGIMPALRAIIEEFSDENDKIIIQPPVYNLFMDIISESKREILFNPLFHDSSYRYNMDFTHLKNLIELKPKIFVICSPHNPVGRIWSSAELECIGQYCLENKILLVVDEIFCDLVLPGKKFISFGTLHSELLKNTIILNSPTKTFNFTGLRGGNILVFNDTLKDRLVTRFCRHSVNKLNTFYISATIAAYKNGKVWLNDLMSYINENYIYLKTFTDKHLPLLKVSPMDSTFLVWINFEDYNISEETLINLLHDDIMLSYGSMFGPNGNGYFRINIACPLKILKVALKLIKIKLDKNTIKNCY